MAVTTDNTLMTRSILFDIDEMTALMEARADKLSLSGTKKALAYAIEKHAGQLRKNIWNDDVIPYIYYETILS